MIYPSLGPKLRAARESASYSLERASFKLNMKTSDIEAMEQGIKTASVLELMRFAFLYCVPCGYFITSEMQQDVIGPEDAETLTSSNSADFCDFMEHSVINDYVTFYEEEYDE